MEKKNKNENNSATIDMGVIEKIEDGGYIVASYTRNGITTPPIKAMQETDTFSLGDQVFFFLFSTGDGRILGKT